MADYGLTPNGPNIKRLDVILDDLHKNLSEKWGVNTRQNPESLLNHLLTNIADRCAELWELGEDIYYSMYPATAEGRSLDNAAQYGGSTRENAAKSYYPIHCTGTDGTVLSAGTLISSTTNPTTQLSLTGPKKLPEVRSTKSALKSPWQRPGMYTPQPSMARCILFPRRTPMLCRSCADSPASSPKRASPHP